MRLATWAHRNCTYILPRHYPKKCTVTAKQRWYDEGTHGCWCSSWKVDLDGTMKKWSEEKYDWILPSRGECYISKG